MGLLDRIKANIPINSIREPAERAIDKERTERRQEATIKTLDRMKQIREDEEQDKISHELAEKLRKRSQSQYDKARVLPGDRVIKGGSNVRARLEKGVSRLAADMAKPQKKGSGVQKETTTTDKSGKITTTRTFYKPEKPRGRPRSYHAPRGGFKAPSFGGGGGGIPRAPPMNFTVPAFNTTKKKQKNGKKSPLDPFNFDVDF
jgi:hypothetical protein